MTAFGAFKLWQKLPPKPGHNMGRWINYPQCQQILFPAGGRADIRTWRGEPEFGTGTHLGVVVLQQQRADFRHQLFTQIRVVPCIKIFQRVETHQNGISIAAAARADDVDAKMPREGTGLWHNFIQPGFILRFAGWRNLMGNDERDMLLVGLGRGHTSPQLIKIKGFIESMK
ncbi:hypothetical protein SRABI106_04721 [Rahnella aquatilis]|nr:hypothetical protein SRABI106_04721 [Rahnella aquatilis]